LPRRCGMVTTSGFDIGRSPSRFFMTDMGSARLRA
jgi:hypothetical protein